MTAVSSTRARALAARATVAPAARVRGFAARHPALSGFALFGTLAAASRPASFRTPIGRDTGAYLYIGHLMLHGGTPYADAANNKGPLTYLLFAAIDATAGTSVIGVRLWLLLFTALAALALSGYVAHFAGRDAGILAGVAFALLAANDPLEGTDPNSLQFGIAPAAAAWWLATRASWPAAAGAGALTAAAAAINPSWAIIAPLVALELWRSRRPGRLSRFGAAAGGGLVVVGVLALWLALSGALDDMLHQLGTQSQGSVIVTHSNKTVYPVTRPFAGRTLHELTDVPGSGFFALGIVACLVAARDRRLRRAAVPALALIVLTWARVKLATYEYPHHYFPAVLGVSAGVALGIASVWRPDAWSRIGLAATVLAVPVWTFVGNPQWRALAVPAPERYTVGSQYGHAYPVAEWLRRRTPPDATVMVSGSQAEVYWLAERRAPNRYFDSFAALRPEDARRREQALFAHPPDAVASLFGHPLDDDLQRLVDRRRYRYVYSDPVGGSIWLRPGLRTGPPGG